MTHQGGHLWGHGASPAPRGCRENRGPKPPNPPGKHCAGPPRAGPELTIHGFLLEEGRHGQAPLPGGPVRPGPVRNRERTGERTGPGRARGGEAEGAEERAGSPGRTAEGGIRAASRRRLAGAQVTAN